MFKKSLITVFVLVCFVTAAVAQDDACPALVQEAIERTDEYCSDIQRNQACYGNLQLAAEPQLGVSDFQFSSPGDIEAIENILALNLSALTAPQEWGVAMMRVQANLPDTLPGQNVTILLFGDIRLENQGTAELPTITIRAGSNINIRSGPATTFRVLGGLTANQEVTVDGINPAGDWLRIVQADGSSGWVYLPLVTVEEGADIGVLVETEEARGAEGVVYGPMQSFYFTSGVGEPQCSEAPRDGILVQTPAGVGRINLLINEVAIQVGSTVFIRAVPADYIYFWVLDGEIWAGASGETAVAPAGSLVRVPTDAGALPSGPPEILAYDEDDLQSLPLSLLPDRITVPATLDEEALEEARLRSRSPLSGDWRLDAASCGEPVGTVIPIEFDTDASRLTMLWFGDVMIFNRVEGATYIDTEGIRDFFVLSPESISSVNTENSCSIALSRIGD